MGRVRREPGFKAWMRLVGYPMFADPLGPTLFTNSIEDTLAVDAAIGPTLMTGSIEDGMETEVIESDLQ